MAADSKSASSFCSLPQSLLNFKLNDFKIIAVTCSLLPINTLKSHSKFVKAQPETLFVVSNTLMSIARISWRLKLANCLIDCTVNMKYRIFEKNGCIEGAQVSVFAKPFWKSKMLPVICLSHL